MDVSLEEEKLKLRHAHRHVLRRVRVCGRARGHGCVDVRTGMPMEKGRREEAEAAASE